MSPVLMQGMTQVPPVGGYFSLGKIILMLVLIVPWVLTAPWVNKDAKRLHLQTTMWSLVALCGGALGVLIWLLVPTYFVGLLFYLLLTAASLVAYVAYRNSRVPADVKVLSAAHFQRLFRRPEVKTVEVLAQAKLYGSNGRIVLPPNIAKAGPEETQAYNTAQTLLHEVVWRRASEAELAPLKDRWRLLLLVDGVPLESPAPEPVMCEEVIQFLKVHAGLNVEDRRRPQQGRIAVDAAGRHVDIMVTTAGTTGGQRMQFRIEQEAVRTNLEELGLEEEQFQQVREMVRAPHGILIVSGRPKNGVTSTLYSLLRQYDAFMKLLVTLERKPDLDLENVTQHAYDQDEKLPDALASALRRDPDVVLVDQCPDSRTAELIVSAAAQKNILLGMHAPDAFTALARWVKVAGPVGAERATANLHGILCQVLLRKLCSACKEAYRPDPGLLAKANLQSQRIEQFYRPPTRPLTDEKGKPIICSSCQGSGYVGRTGAFELVRITDELRHLVVSGAPVAQIKAEARKAKMLYLQERALQKVIRGETSVHEVIRVSQDSTRK